ncbi:MAG: lactate utilization protein LutB domain-containing protein, partial [Acidimicrobiia bacterium]
PPARRIPPAPRRAGFALWARLWASPAGYRISTAGLRRLSRLVPAPLYGRLPGVSGWSEGRDVPLPAARSFRQRLAAREEEGW